MEVVLYNSTVCRLCAEENDNGTFLYSSEENNQNISDLVNAYLPIKVSDDGLLPRTICPGCTIQLEATVEFLNLIVTGQKAIRGLYQREKEYKKNLNKASANESAEALIVEVDPLGNNGAYQEGHPISLQVAGLDRPKRKRGRPPKKAKPPDEQAMEAAVIEQEVKIKQRDEEPTGKRRRKTPERFKEVVQGKELDQIFIEEGMTDGEDSDNELKLEKNKASKEQSPKVPEVIGHTSVSGELVVVVKGKGRGRPKGRTKQTRETCAICGKEFSNAGRYMSHIAQHGPVLYQCRQCEVSFSIRLDFNNHQQETSHEGLNILPGKDNDIIDLEPASQELLGSHPDPPQSSPELFATPELVPVEKVDDVGPSSQGSMPDLNPQPEVNAEFPKLPDLEAEGNESELKNEVNTSDVKHSPGEESPRKHKLKCPYCDKKYSSKQAKSMHIKVRIHVVNTPDVKHSPGEESPRKHKLKCPYCDKKYSSKQAKSMHIKAAHKGERPYICNECGASFAYPRALTLHSLAHRRRNTSKGFACDLCGKVLNHPSSVAYHKEAEHANQRYVCNKCGKHFKHKQLLQRHQLVHTQNRPFHCKVCNAKFKTKANLMNHQMLHTGIKKFSCEECKQRFAHKTSLTLHMRWHRGQKPYACKICEKAFTQKGNLSEHMRIHTGEKPFQCALCPRKFTTSSQHRLHLRRHEPKAHRLNPAHRVPPIEDSTTTIVSDDGSLIHFTINAGDVTSSADDNAVTSAAHSSDSTTTTIVSDDGSLIHFTINAGDVTSSADDNAVTSAAHSSGNSVNGSGSSSATVHKCAWCHRVCPTRWALCKHTRLHTGEKPFQCVHCARSFADASNLNKHKKQIHKQTSLLAVQPGLLPALPRPLQALPEAPLAPLAPLHAEGSLAAPQYVVETEDDEERVIYVTYDVDARSPHYQIMDSEQAEVSLESPEGCELYSGESLLLQPKAQAEEPEHMSVMDEQGNPLHFTMQDGTRLAITSLDGQSLQVITQDGQTIPVEINGFTQDEEESPMQNESVQELELKEDEPASPVTHYYTIV